MCVACSGASDGSPYLYGHVTEASDFLSLEGPRGFLYQTS